MSSDHTAPKNRDTVKPFSVIVTENPKNGGITSKDIIPVLKALMNSDKSDVEVLALARLTGNDLKEDLRSAVSKAAKNQPVQIIYLSNKAPHSLMVMDHAPLFKQLDHDGQYPLKIATTASVNLGDLTDFEKQYGIGLYSISSVGMDVISRRLLAYDTASIRQTPAPEAKKPQQPPRSLHEMFAETEKLQRSVAGELHRIEQEKPTEAPPAAHKKQTSPRVRLKRRRPS